MKLVHPMGNDYNGIPSSDVFFAVDDLGTPHGTGYLVYQCQPSLMPDNPINIYFSLEGTPEVKYLLFGALMARARQIRECDPTVAVRIYTAVNPQDMQNLSFYADNGLSMDDCEQRVVMPIPVGDGIIPMTYTVAETPLDSLERADQFIARMQQNDMVHVTRDMAAGVLSTPHGKALQLYQGVNMVAEVLVGGMGSSAELHAIYTLNGARRQGHARMLLHRTLAIMGKQGVTGVTATLLTRSAPSRRLLNSFGAQVAETTAIYPSLTL